MAPYSANVNIECERKQCERERELAPYSLRAYQPWNTTLSCARVPGGYLTRRNMRGKRQPVEPKTNQTHGHDNKTRTYTSREIPNGRL